MNRMKSEQTAVRTRIRTAEIHFRRLQQGLDQAYTNLQRQPIPASKEASNELPPDFFARLNAATLADRTQIVKERFEIEAVLTAHVSRGATAGYDIRFDPKPPLDRLYFLSQTGQLIRLEQLSNVVLVADLVTGQSTEMKLVEFVKLIQNGVWLLKTWARTN